MISTPDQLRPMVQEMQGFIFDLDGTLYLGDELLPGAADCVARLRAADKKVAFVSNKPIGRRGEFAAKLDKLGIPCRTEDVINSALVVARYLEHVRPGARCFPVAEPPVIEELLAHGLTICEDPEEIEVVVVSFDRTFDYRKLDIAYRAALHGADLIATNPDRTCPMPGYDLPDAACMIAAIEACTERKVEPIVGKPSGIMLKESLDLLGLDAAHCAMVGDRPETDILMAHKAQMTGILVLTGVATAAAAAALPERPDYIIESVATLAEALSPR